MKKTIMIALAGMVMFAFTQCGSKNDGESKDGKGNAEATVSGSKEYQNAVKGFNEMTNVLKNAKDCEKLEEDMDRISEKYNKKFDEKDQMTDKEEDEWEKMREDLEDIIDETAERLGCY